MILALLSIYLSLIFIQRGTHTVSFSSAWIDHVQEGFKQYSWTIALRIAVYFKPRVRPLAPPSASLRRYCMCMCMCSAMDRDTHIYIYIWHLTMCTKTYAYNFANTRLFECIDLVFLCFTLALIWVVATPLVPCKCWFWVIFSSVNACVLHLCSFTAISSGSHQGTQVGRDRRNAHGGHSSAQSLPHARVETCLGSLLPADPRCVFVLVCLFMSNFLCIFCWGVKILSFKRQKQMEARKKIKKIRG